MTVRHALLAGAILASLPCGLEAAGAARARFSVGAPPAWVQPVAPDVPERAPSEQVAGGIYVLLSDRQVRVGSAGREAYGRYTKQIVNEAGLNNASQVTVDFDPGYQRLALHSVRVLREGTWRNRLDRARVQLIQREPELESQIYDGTVSAVLFVEDLRVGDVIDYSFTITGANPIFGGRYLDAFATEWSVPLHQMRFRLLWPPSRKLFVRNHRTTIAPVTREAGGLTECVWERWDPSPIVGEANVPSWFDSYGWVQLSEFETWAEVAEWGRRLFEIPSRISPELAARVATWRERLARDGALAALRFVQDEVRYLGIELGVGSHKPSAPARVLARRFGDCKDKAVLLCTLLHELGIEARPALVNTVSGRALDQWQPSPYAFDHVIVQLVLDGRSVWVDPTLTAQGGTLPDVFVPNYARALVLDENSVTLTSIPPPKRPRPSTYVQEAYRIKDFDSPVEYVVVSRYGGPDADRMRNDFQQRSRDELGHSYVKYYSRFWPGIRADGPVEIADDRASNVLTTTERYAISRFWSSPNGKKPPEAELWAGTVDNAVPDPARVERWSPFGLSYPLHVRHVTQVELPEEWDVTPESANASDAAVRFGFRSRREGRKVTLDYEFEILTDAVPPAEFPRHLRTLDRVRDRLAFRLQRALPAAEGTNWFVLCVLGSFGVFGVTSAVVVCRRHPLSEPVRVRAPSLEGVRGWLLVFASFLVWSLVGEVNRAWVARDSYALSTWTERTSPGAARYVALWEPLQLLDLFSIVALVVGHGLLLAMLLRRRRRLPSVYAGFVGLQALLFLARALLAQHVPEAREEPTLVFLDALGRLGCACAWIPYLFSSDRARSTLIR